MAFVKLKRCFFSGFEVKEKPYTPCLSFGENTYRVLFDNHIKDTLYTVRGNYLQAQNEHFVWSCAMN